MNLVKRLVKMLHINYVLNLVSYYLKKKKEKKSVFSMTQVFSHLQSEQVLHHRVDHGEPQQLYGSPSETNHKMTLSKVGPSKYA